MFIIEIRIIVVEIGNVNRFMIYICFNPICYVYYAYKICLKITKLSL